MVELTISEYEAVRAHPRRFVLVAGHEAHFDLVVADGGDYEVVVKHGVAGRIAEQSDPRAERSS